MYKTEADDDSPVTIISCNPYLVLSLIGLKSHTLIKSLFSIIKNQKCVLLQAITVLIVSLHTTCTAHALLSNEDTCRRLSPISEAVLDQLCGTMWASPSLFIKSFPFSCILKAATKTLWLVYRIHSRTHWCKLGLTFHISLGFQYSKPHFISTGSPGTDSTYLILLLTVSIYNAQAVQHLSSTQLACGINLL